MMLRVLSIFISHFRRRRQVLVADDTDRGIRITGGETATVFTAPHLPHEIIVEIISRLPVKSVCRFRCVSKLWLSTISTPQFAKTHLALAFQNNTRKQKLIYWAGREVCSIDWESVSGDDVINKGLVADVLDNSLKDNPCLFTFLHILSSSNGLVCILDSNEESVLVTNPCTGESRRVLIGSQKHDHWEALAFGFGYSSKSDDYKLVIMDREMTRMYSLLSDTWSKFTLPLNYALPIGVNGVPLSGALHWVGNFAVDGYEECAVVCFGLDEKTIRGMPLPFPVYDIDDIFYISLGVVNGCLCAHYCAEDDDVFWVMREYNNGESWTKISSSSVPLDTLGLAENRVKIEKVDRKIVLCNFENGTHGIPTEGEFRVVTYVESLISPNHYVGE